MEEVHRTERVLEKGHDEGRAMLDARTAIRDLPEVATSAVLLPLEVEGAVVGRDLVNLACTHGLAERLDIVGLPERWAHHVLGTRKAVLPLLEVAPVIEQEILRAGLERDAHTPCPCGTHLLEPERGRAVHDSREL